MPKTKKGIDGHDAMRILMDAQDEFFPRRHNVLGTWIKSIHTAWTADRDSLKTTQWQRDELSKLIDEYRERAEKAEASIKVLEEALEPFQDFADYLELETEGFADRDRIKTTVNGDEFPSLTFGNFRAARAAPVQS